MSCRTFQGINRPANAERFTNRTARSLFDLLPCGCDGKISFRFESIQQKRRFPSDPPLLRALPERSRFCCQSAVQPCPLTIPSWFPGRTVRRFTAVAARGGAGGGGPVQGGGGGGVISSSSSSPPVCAWAWGVLQGLERSAETRAPPCAVGVSARRRCGHARGTRARRRWGGGRRAAAGATTTWWEAGKGGGQQGLSRSLSLSLSLSLGRDR